MFFFWAHICSLHPQPAPSERLRISCVPPGDEFSRSLLKYGADANSFCWSVLHLKTSWSQTPYSGSQVSRLKSEPCRRERIAATPERGRNGEALLRSTPQSTSMAKYSEIFAGWRSAREGNFFKAFPPPPACFYLMKFVQTRGSCSGRGTEERAAARLLIIQAMLLPRARMV